MPRLDHAAFETDDPDALAAFYERFFGARVVRAEGHPVMAYLGNTGLALHETGGPGTHTAIRVSESERAELRRKLDAAGIEWRERDHDIAVGLFFEDPDGRTIEAITYRSGDDPRRPDTSHVAVGTLERVLDAFNAHDLDAIMSFFADDCVFEMPRGPAPWGRRFEGHEAVREGLASRFAGIPDVHYGDDRHWVAGDRGCSEWLLTGTTTDGEKIEVRGCDLWEFRDGKIVRKDSYWKIVEK